MKIEALYPVVALCLAVPGCAVTQVHLLLAEAPPRLIVVEVPMQVNADEMKGLFGAKKDGANGNVASAVDRAERPAFSTLRTSLRSATIEIDDSVSALTAVHDLGLDREEKVTAAQIHRPGETTRADALLRFRITDYGVTPRAWRKGVIIFEVTTTLGIAALAYAYPKTRPLAGIYLVEEGIEETLEYYGGLWTLDKVCRPVRIEAELIQLKTGATAWTGVATGLSNVSLGRIVRDVGSLERDAQLDLALRAAVNRLATDLAKALSPNEAPSLASGAEGHSVSF